MPASTSPPPARRWPRRWLRASESATTDRQSGQVCGWTKANFQGRRASYRPGNLGCHELTGADRSVSNQTKYRVVLRSGVNCGDGKSIVLTPGHYIDNAPWAVKYVEIWGK
ncbi:peptidase inhibitor family I36 protein [Streptomyces orinoci]|uniref:Peptidase inhibitor family I36 protein n=1 Tax=Streptomyces orinoci TaxID=67339 RepID=A0ABV3JTS8_STRON